MIIKGVTLGPIAVKLIAAVLLYALGYVGMHLLHLPPDEIQEIDKDAEHLVIEAIEAEL